MGIRFRECVGAILRKRNRHERHRHAFVARQRSFRPPAVAQRHLPRRARSATPRYGKRHILGSLGFDDSIRTDTTAQIMGFIDSLFQAEISQVGCAVVFQRPAMQQMVDDMAL